MFPQFPFIGDLQFHQILPDCFFFFFFQASINFSYLIFFFICHQCWLNANRKRTTSKTAKSQTMIAFCVMFCMGSQQLENYAPYCRKMLFISLPPLAIEQNIYTACECSHMAIHIVWNVAHVLFLQAAQGSRWARVLTNTQYPAGQMLNGTSLWVVVEIRAVFFCGDSSRMHNVTNEPVVSSSPLFTLSHFLPIYGKCCPDHVIKIRGAVTSFSALVFFGGGGFWRWKWQLSLPN